MPPACRVLYRVTERRRDLPVVINFVIAREESPTAAGAPHNGAPAWIIAVLVHQAPHPVPWAASVRDVDQHATTWPLLRLVLRGLFGKRLHCVVPRQPKIAQVEERLLGRLKSAMVQPVRVKRHPEPLVAAHRMKTIHKL